MIRPRTFAALALTVAGGLTYAASAQEGDTPVVPELITVDTKGQVVRLPNAIEFQVRVKVSHKTADEARKQFTASRTQALQAFGEIGHERIQSDGESLSYGVENDDNIWFNGEQPAKQVTIQELLSVIVPVAQDVSAQRELMAVLVDAALEAGLHSTAVPQNNNRNVMRLGQAVASLGSEGAFVQASVRGHFTEAEQAALEKDALEVAMNVARRRAAVVAESTGRKVGAVHSMRANPQDSSTSWMGLGVGTSHTVALQVAFLFD